MGSEFPTSLPPPHSSPPSPPFAYLLPPPTASPTLILSYIPLLLPPFCQHITLILPQLSFVPPHTLSPTHPSPSPLSSPTFPLHPSFLSTPLSSSKPPPTSNPFLRISFPFYLSPTPPHPPTKSLPRSSLSLPSPLLLTFPSPPSPFLYGVSQM